MEIVILGISILGNMLIRVEHSKNENTRLQGGGWSNILLSHALPPSHN